MDPRIRTRIMPMKVLSLSLGRSGTMSMKAALEILGFPTYHFVEFIANPPDGDMWVDGLNIKYAERLNLESTHGNRPAYGREEFDQLLGHVSAVTDFPSAIFAEELIAAYPEAKILLVERDVEAWYESFMNSIGDALFNPAFKYVGYLDPHLIARIHQISWPMGRGFFNAKSKAELTETARETYLKHNEFVRRIAPPKRFLSYKLGSGWGPLCEFLEVEVPKGVNFPRLNETKEFQKLVRKYITGGIWTGVKRFSPGAITILAVAVALWWHL
ncbi:hypothetical protein BCR34DRAFT_622251 [Clohesyomyces aquaticus]|uniref:P-loop containing nucleoside triphosphate hydrolase protein n=1 Tax=Clohesyomyces aquaticus TaxID=1231657 RepID=A0A1Y2A2W0_9PLEO|nr:hypothetical protein BCR34DRAFT_622251 [Clohesyomyces aquaticus]